MTSMPFQGLNFSNLPIIEPASQKFEFPMRGQQAYFSNYNILKQIFLISCFKTNLAFFIGLLVLSYFWLFSNVL